MQRISAAAARPSHPPRRITTTKRRTSVSSGSRGSGGRDGKTAGTCDAKSRCRARSVRCKAMIFRFGGNNSKSAGMVGSQSRDDFGYDDVEQYFNYTGMLATEGSYASMEALLKEMDHPCDVLLLLASREGDLPKVEELLDAGARPDVCDASGRSAMTEARNDETKKMLTNAVET